MPVTEHVSTSTRWFDFASRANHDFSDEPAVSCYAGKLFSFESTRFVGFHWTSSTRRYSNSLCPSRRRAEDLVEARRTKGTSWVITEIPAVVVAGHEDALVLAEGYINDAKAIALDSPTLEGIGNSLLPRFRTAVVTAAREFPPADLPYRWYDSSSSGGSYRLHWSPRRRSDEFGWVFDMVAHICKHLQDAAPL